MRLIDADDFIEAMEYADADVIEDYGDSADFGFSIANIREVINKVDAVDAVPVVHGKWINPHFRNSYYCCNCSACSGEAMHMEFRWHKKGIYRICPNCGADMREAAHETN